VGLQVFLQLQQNVLWGHSISSQKFHLLQHLAQAWRGF
jgi:hypothetical protein